MSPKSKDEAFQYHSGLPEQELCRLWETVKERWPEAYERITNPDYSDENYHEEAMSLDGVVHDVIRSEHPKQPMYPQHYDIYHDMKVFLGLYLTPNSIRGAFRHDDRN